MRLHYSAQLFCLHCTLVWLFCRKLPFYFHQTPSWFWLVWTNSPVFTPTRVCPSNMCPVWQCVERGHVCMHKAHFPSSPRSVQLLYFHCTLVWLFICKTHLLSSTHPIMALASRHSSTNNARIPPYYGHASSPRIPGLYHIQGIDHIKMVVDHDI